MAELQFEIRPATAAITEEEKGCPRPHPGWQPARRAELRGLPTSASQALPWTPLGPASPHPPSRRPVHSAGPSPALRKESSRGWGTATALPLCPPPLPGEGGHSREAPSTPKAQCHHAQASGLPQEIVAEGRPGQALPTGGPCCRKPPAWLKAEKGLAQQPFPSTDRGQAEGALQSPPPSTPSTTRPRENLGQVSGNF